MLLLQLVCAMAQVHAERLHDVMNNRTVFERDYLLVVVLLAIDNP
jgi:hypothetical protein